MSVRVQFFDQFKQFGSILKYFEKYRKMFLFNRVFNNGKEKICTYYSGWKITYKMGHVSN